MYTYWAARDLPQEIITLIMDFVWPHTPDMDPHNGREIGPYSLVCKSFYFETRRRLFKTLDFRDDDSRIWPPRQSRSARRLSSFQELLQDSPHLTGYVHSITLRLSCDPRFRVAAIIERDYRDLPFLVGLLQGLRLFECTSTQKVEWQDLDDDIRAAVLTATALPAMESIRLSRFLGLPASALELKTPEISVQLVDSYVAPDPQKRFAMPCERMPRNFVKRLHLEHSDVSNLLLRNQLALSYLRFLHAQLIDTSKTQQLIDGARLTLEEFSCRGKAMSLAARGPEHPAGVGPFSFRGCCSLKVWRADYLTYRGNVTEFTENILSSLATLRHNPLDELNLTLGFSTPKDMIVCMASPLWQLLDAEYANFHAFHRVTLNLDTSPNRCRLSKTLTPLPLERSRYDGLELCDTKKLIQHLKTAMPQIVASKALSLNMMVDRMGPLCLT
ncbi:hypothetical protein FA15DRAFT_148102 [Coprinopsis marcescibilis]|uniref:F-box domain-containing protein n=1 Tax=Coprinopsis marcescibilis TaxID=230819 RepID=A0A5C3L4N3_COPMA|nr:hypothetical protein FA15DRAFT_148102 [Coprinopsis marcescibilis]